MDLKHVCCNLSVVKHQMKREEAGFSGEGATRGDTLSTRKCVMSGEFRLNHSEVAVGVGNAKLSVMGEVTETCCLPGQEGTVCLMRVGLGYVNRQVMGLSLAQQKLGPFLSIVTSVLVFVVDESKTEFGI